MFERFNDGARRVVVLAQEEARMLNHNYIGTEHVLLGLLREAEGVAYHALTAFDIGLEGVRQQVEEIIGRGQHAPTGHIPFTPRSKKVFEQSLREALQLGHNYIGTEHILLGLIHEGEGVAAQLIVKLGAGLNQVRAAVIALLPGDQPVVAAQSAVPVAAEPEVVGRNLTRLAREGGLGRVVGRQREIGQVMQILMLEAAVPLLVGEQGVGVTAVAHGVAQAMVQPGSPRWFAGKEIIELHLDQLTATATGPQDLDDRVSGLIGQVRDQPATIWLIDHSLSPAYTSAAETVPAIALLRPVLVTGELLAIAAATPAEHRQHLAVDADLRGDFTDVEVSEVPAHVAVEVLKGVRDRQQARHQVSIDDDVIATAVALSVQHLPDALLPGKAIDLLDRAAAHASRRSAAANPVQEMEENLNRTRGEKEEAIDRQDFEEAAALYDEQKKITAAIARKQAELKNLPGSGIIAVTQQDVRAALTAFSAPDAIARSR